MEKEIKFCNHCKSFKSIEEFWKRKNTKDNRFGCCAVCERKKAIERSIKNNTIKKYDPVKAKAWKIENQSKVKNQWLKMYYSMSLEEYNKLFEEQEGRCAICGKHQSYLKKGLSVDHDHVTGKIRGLLCNNCNAGIGLLKDDIKLLTIAINYLNGTKNN